MGTSPTQRIAGISNLPPTDISSNPESETPILRAGYWEYLAEAQGLFWSEEVYDILELSPTTQSDWKRLLDGVILELRSHTETYIQNGLEKTGYFQVSTLYQNPQGKHKYLLIEGSVTPIGQSGVVRKSGFIKELTLSQGVFSDYHKVETIFDALPDLIWMIDPQLRLVYANSAFLDEYQERWGMHLEPLQPMFDPLAQPTELVEYWTKAYQKALGGEFFNETVEVQKTTKTIYWDTRFIPITQENEIGLVTCISKDITAQVIKEKEAQDLVEKLNLAQKIGKIGYWEFNMETQSIFWSDEVYEIWGIPVNSIEPNFDYFLSTFLPEDIQPFLQEHEAAITGVKPLDAIHRIQTANAEIKYLREKGTITIIDGVKRFTGTVQDITKEQLTKITLDERNRFIETVLSNISMGIAVNKMDSGEATYINPAFSQIYGWPAEILRNIESFFTAVYPDPVFRQNITSKILADIQSGNPDKMTWKDIPIQTQTGQTKFVSAKNIPIPELNLMISTVLDETDRYWAEHSLRSSNERFHLATQAVSDAIWDWNVEKKEIFWGKGYHKLFGYPADMEYVEESFWQSKVHPEDFDETFKSILQARQNTSTYRWSGQYRFQKADGSYAFVKENTIIIRDQHGSPIRMVGALKDITEDRKTQLLLEEKTELISTTSRITQSFLEVDNWEEKIDESLRLIGEATRADRAYLLRVIEEDEGKLFASQTNEWTNGKVSSELENPNYQYIPLEDHPEFLAQIYERKPFMALVSQLDGLTRKILEEQSIKSILNVPIFVKNQIFGYIGLDDCHEERFWSEDEFSFLNAVTTNLAFVIEKKINLDNHREALNGRNALLESIRDSFFALDKDYRVTYWNNILEKRTGIDRGTIIGRSIWEFIKDPNSDFDNAYEKVLNQGQTVTFETFDSWINAWLEVTMYPSENGLSAIIRDITERKEHDQKIKEINDRLNLVYQASQEAIWEWNIQTNDHYWGEGFNVLFDEEVAGLQNNFDRWSKNVHPEDRDRVFAELNTALLDPKVKYNESEYRFIKKGKRIIYLLDKSLIIRDENGKAIRVVGSIQDISSRKAYEESLKILNQELLESNKELESINKELEQFAFVASHDLQEPIRMISGFLGLIEKKYSPILDETGKKYIHFAVDGAKRMRNVILDLLEFSRAGNISEEKKWIKSDELVREVMRFLAKDIQEKKATIHIGALPEIFCHSNAMMQVFQNLINNGIKYHLPDSNPGIWINGEATDEGWKFSIRDNGIGIEEIYLEKIFVIFQRLHQKDQFSGSGIGLSICKKIVEYHGGKIWVESTPGQGSTFFFTIKK